MTPFLTELEQQLQGAAQREVASARRGSRGGMRRLRSVIRVAPAVASVAISLLVLVLAVALLHHGHPRMHSGASTVTTPPGAALQLGAPAGPTRPLNRGIGGRIEPRKITVVAEVRDLHGGLPWGLESFRTADGQTCVLAGREQSDRVGVIGENGSFSDDGRFHPFTRYVLSGLCGQTDGNGNAFIDVSEPAAAASGNDQDVVRGGCRPLRATGRDAHPCHAANERRLEYGLLGPDATSVTYTTRGHTATIATGPDGAFIVDGPPTKSRFSADISDRTMPGLVTAIHYRNGSICQPDHAARARRQSPGCPPVGYLRPHLRRVTTAEVHTPVTATVMTAKRWCVNTAGHYIACDERIPTGYQVLSRSSGMVLLQWSWTARVAASGPNAGYEYAIKAGPPCGGGQSSSGTIPARLDQRIVQQSLGSSPCSQEDTISVEYRTNVGAGGANFANPPNPGHDRQPFVGSTTINIPG